MKRLASKLRGEVERLVQRGAEALGSATTRGEVQSPEESDTTRTAVSEEKELTRSAGEPQAVSAAPSDDGDIGDRVAEPGGTAGNTETRYVAWRRILQIQKADARTETKRT